MEKKKIPQSSSSPCRALCQDLLELGIPSAGIALLIVPGLWHLLRASHPKTCQTKHPEHPKMCLMTETVWGVLELQEMFLIGKFRWEVYC